MQVRVLGRVEIAGAGGGAGMERKARELLVLLCLHAPNALTVDDLARLLWDEPPPSATKTVQSHLSRLRSALTDAAVAIERTTGGAYVLRADPGATDVDVVANRRARARQLRELGHVDAAAGLLTEARSMWRGQPELPDSVAALAVVRRWELEHRTLVREHLTAVVDGRQPGRAVAELQSLVTTDPHDQPAWGLLVRGLHRSGASADALRAFQAARRALADIGLEPGPLLTAAETEVLADETHLTGPTTDAGAGGTASPVRYAGEPGARVAYMTMGEGRPGVLVLNPGLISIDSAAEEPRMAGGLARLATLAGVVCFDRRSTGLSDPVPGPAPNLADWVADAVAVLDATGATPVLMAASDTCLLAVALAVTHPSRVRGLVLVHGYARYVRGDGYPYGIDDETARATSADSLAIEPRPGSFDPLSHIAPSVAHDATFRRWWERMGQRAASPAVAAAMHRVIMAADVRAALPDVSVPVLLLHRRSCSSCDVGHARYLSEHIPDACLVLLPGADELWFTGDDGELLDQVERFVSSCTTSSRSR